MGKFPPPGRAAGANMKLLIPGILLAFIWDSAITSLTERVRFDQDFKRIPPNADVGCVI